MRDREEGEEDVDQESLPRKRQKNEDDQADPEKKEDDENDVDFVIKTGSVKQFVNVLSGFGHMDIECVVMAIAPSGMQLYAVHNKGAAVLSAVFARSMFEPEPFDVPGQVTRIFDRNRVESLKKKIAKDVESLEISNWPEGPGFKFKGEVNIKGVRSFFEFYLAHRKVDVEVVNLSRWLWHWQVITSAHTFKKNVEFIDNSNGFIELSLHKDGKIEFRGVQDTGEVGEVIGHQTESKLDQEFRAVFVKKLLRVVTASCALNNTLKIGFNLDERHISWPVHFSYEIEPTVPPSIFSCFIMPAGSNTS